MPIYIKANLLCDFACRYCYEHPFKPKEQKIDYDAVESTVRRLHAERFGKNDQDQKPRKQSYIGLHGGEPLFQDKKDIGFGEEIGEKVRSGIESATHVVLLLSSHIVNSPWVAYEAGYARRHGIPIVVYLTEPSLPIPTFLGNTRAIASRSDEEQFLAEVRRARCVGG